MASAASPSAWPRRASSPTCSRRWRSSSTARSAAGDAITFDKSSGTVESVGIRSTRIRGVNGEQRVIGNKKLLDQEIVNNTQRQYRRIVFTLGIVQTTPVEVMEKLPQLLKEVVEKHGLKYVRAGFANFGASSFDFDVEFDSPSAAFQDMYDARHAVGVGIIACLNAHCIGLAYPTQTSITAQQGGMQLDATPDNTPNAAALPPSAATPRPPSSGDRSAADQ